MHCLVPRRFVGFSVPLRFSSFSMILAPRLPSNIPKRVYVRGSCVQAFKSNLGTRKIECLPRAPRSFLRPYDFLRASSRASYEDCKQLGFGSVIKVTQEKKFFGNILHPFYTFFAFPLQRDLQDNKLMLANRKFPDLLAVVSALRQDVLLQNCRQLLINPCPRLPLNAIFSGYIDGSARPSGRGRGHRGRGRSQR